MITSSSLSANNIELIVNIVILIAILAFCIIFLWKIKFQQKGYKYLFIVYTMFWIPLQLLRQYTGTLQSAININAGLASSAMLWLPLAAYGFIGIFARVFADYLTFIRKNRKTFIYMALVIQFVTYIPVIIAPSLATNVIQSLGVGIGASCIGTYELMFNEQYGKSKQFMTISFLSIPPLLADFVTNPIQGIVLSIDPSSTAKSNPDTLIYLWVIGLVFVVITMIMCFWVKEDQKQLYKDQKHKTQIKGKVEYFYFALIALVGFMVAFVKFGNSGSIAVLYINKISDLTTTSGDSALSPYTSMVFSSFQLIGGLVTGMYLVKKIGVYKSFSIGCFIWIVFHISIMFSINQYTYFALLSLNGLAYGIIYNLILGFVLQKKFTSDKTSPMGIYQSVLALGIMISTWFNTWVKSDDILGATTYEVFIANARILYGVAIGAIVLCFLLFTYSKIIEKNNFKTIKPWVVNSR